MHRQMHHLEEDLADTSHKLKPEYLDLERALAQIEETQAAAITLNVSLGYSHSEISDILELPLGTVKSQINRGVKKLKELMTENTDERQS